MDIHILGPSSYSLYLPRRQYPAKITEQSALSILKSALHRSLTGEVTLFSGKDGYLFFVKEASATPEVFAFDSLEELLSVPVEETVPSSLYYYDERYLLALYPLYGSTSWLGEFGEKLDMTPELWCHIREHGKALAEKGALRLLQSLALT